MVRVHAGISNTQQYVEPNYNYCHTTDTPLPDNLQVIRNNSLSLCVAWVFLAQSNGSQVLEKITHGGFLRQTRQLVQYLDTRIARRILEVSFESTSGEANTFSSLELSLNNNGMSDVLVAFIDEI